MSQHTVLIVDDHADIRRLIRMTLEFEDYQIHEAADGESALQLAGQGTHRAIGSLFGDSFGSATDWRRWAGSLGALAVAAVFMFWQAQNQVEQLASEDSALLSEALPPTALIDKGFQSWISSGTPDVQE